MFSSYNTLFLGKVHHHLTEIPSTNDYALELIKKKEVIEGTLITTDHQYRGKGQRGKSWVTQPGENLTFSLILKPSFLDLKHHFYLNQAITNGIFKWAQTELGAAFKIKWPNDLYYNDDKLGGILIENQSKGNQITHAVVGIGINVNQVHFDPQLPNPISLKKINKRSYQVWDVLTTLLPHLEQSYLQLKAHNYTQIRATYLSTIYKLNESAAFKKGNEIFRAKIANIQPSGQMELETMQGIQVFGFQELEMLL